MLEGLRQVRIVLVIGDGPADKILIFWRSHAILVGQIVIRGKQEHMSAQVLENLPRNCYRLPHVCLPRLSLLEHEGKRVEELAN